MKKIILVLALVTGLVACKNDVKESVPNEIAKQVVEETKKELVLKMNFKTNKQDDFKIMLNNILVDELQKKNIHFIEKVSPTTSTEIISANFGENFSNNLIISLGNKAVKTVEISSVDLSYGNQSLSIPANQISKYFVLNKFISQDESSFALKTIKVDGKHNPTLVLKRSAINQLSGKNKSRENK